MASLGGDQAHLTESQKQSAYFNQDTGYDPAVYENTPENWVKIFGMLGLFYVFQGLHWWANYELGIHDSQKSTEYNLIIFGTAILIIALMLFVGSGVNRLKVTHEFYQEVISQEKQRQNEI